MIKISQLPDADKHNGGEVFPIVQDGVTKKASALFTDPELKVHVPENAAIVTSVEGTEINLISAKVVDGVVTVFVGDKEVSLHQDSNIIVTETEKSDGNTYVRINNKWSVRNPVTQINDVSAPTGGGKINLNANDVKAHIENPNRDGVSYVSRDGGWIKLETNEDILREEINKKADKVHTHTIADVTGLDAKLEELQENIDTKTHEITDIIGLQDGLTAIHNDIDATNSKIDSEIVDVKGLIDKKADKIHTHEIADVTGLQTELDKIDVVESGINEVKDRLQTAMVYTRDTGFTGSEATGVLPLTQKASLKTSVADNVISFTEAGTYFVQLNVKIDSDGTVVTMKGVPDMIIDGKGHASVSGIFDLSTSTKISLEYTGENSIVDSNVVIHRI